MARHWQRGAAALAVVALFMRASVGCGDDGTATPRDAGTDRRDARYYEDDFDTGSYDNTPRPAFCEGLMLYASFDTDFRPELGPATPQPWGTPRIISNGHFGGALELNVDPNERDASAALYLVRSNGGEAVYPENAGTLALWYRTDRDPEGFLYRPVGVMPPGYLGAGLALAEPLNTPNSFGLVNRPLRSDPDQEILITSKNAMRPFLRRGDYNHYVTTWRRGNGGGQPTASIVLNGGRGEVFDGGADANFPDGRAPYLRYTSNAWDYDASVSAVALRLGTDSVTRAGQAFTPQGAIDDLAVWNRVLSFEEIAQVYAAGALGQTCKVR